MGKTIMMTDNSLKLYEQVVHYLVVRIEAGEWTEHEKLPSVRSLSELLGVHRLTVFKAYQELKERGNVYVKDKSGYYVSPADPAPIMDQADDPAVSAWLHWDSLDRVQSLEAEFQFSKSLIDPALLPNRYWGELMRDLLNHYPRLLGTYSTNQGDLELRSELASHLTSRERFYISADEVLITSGAQQAIDLIARSLVKPGDRVLVERPTYGPAMEIFRKQGAKLVFTDITSEGYDLDQIELLMKQEKPKLFYMTPTFQNPTGINIPVEQRKQLPELAEQYGCFLVEDDSTYDIYFKEKPPAPIFTYDTTGHTLYIRSYSKYVVPGLRIAAIMCRPRFMPGLQAIKSLADNGSPLLNQKLFLRYFQSPRMYQHISKLCTAIQLRMEVMEKCLKETDWRWTTPQGGLNIWVELPEGMDTGKLLHRCMEHSVAFVPGTVFDPSDPGASRKLRLSYSYAHEQQIYEGMSRLIELAHKMT
ncbi:MULTISPECIES: aminotransferase-like domain-containing protein [Paenibacillus]|uniref:DNA-binding transcriptional MocR family regulator n=1 Tax=Paenibacillus amylolyticus TaxID=1451 RepID=A0AAP5H2N5_PAEAM|nr:MULTISPECIES: PLP-dependent aminotransferase family protein [Paenibacillus]MDR6724165.1 DNA-binding transcriptional MocR family regulator [Paenibacillus amylolyticus]